MLTVEQRFNIILRILAGGRCSATIVLLILPITSAVACNSVFIGSLHPARNYVLYETRGNFPQFKVHVIQHQLHQRYAISL